MSERKPRMYGSDVHPTRPEDPARCVHALRSNWTTRQCSRARGLGPDGLYCAQHDPGARAARVERRQEEWRAEERSRAEARTRDAADLALGRFLRTDAARQAVIAVAMDEPAFLRDEDFDCDEFADRVLAALLAKGARP